MKQLTFGSLFAGCGCFDLAAENAGMTGLWQVERDRECIDVLTRHWPDRQRIADVIQARAILEPKNAGKCATTLVRPDCLIGGFPCQDLSVAGRRAGLGGSRSGMWFVFRRILGIVRPRWVFIENVPGLLSSQSGRDMGIILRSLGNLGYGYAYRVLDAQWFGVAQRRRRVFIVGCLGSVRSAAEILFESNSLPWDSPPSRSSREAVADCLTAGAHPGSHNGQDDRKRGHLIPIAFAQNQRDEVRDLGDLAGAIAAEQGVKQQTYVAIPKAFAIQERAVSENLANGPQGKGWQPDIAYTLEARHHAQAVAYRTSGNCGVMTQGDRTAALNCATDPNQTIVQTHYGVRRLTPREYERLQGLPDDWTRYRPNGDEISDSARYRMLGNSGALPKVEWIMRRIVEAVGDTDRRPDQ